MFAKSTRGLRCLLKAFKPFMPSTLGTMLGTVVHRAEEGTVLPELAGKRVRK